MTYFASRSMRPAPRGYFRSATLAFSSLLCVGLVTPPARGLQPLAVFVSGAAHNPVSREARATTEAREADQSTATGRLFPQLSAGASYTRNEYQVALDLPVAAGTATGAAAQRLVIQPYNQYDANIALSVPLLDIGAWERRAATQASFQAQRYSERETAFETERQVTQAYFQLVANAALLESATRNLAVAQQNADTVAKREQSGTASELDVQRALSDVARSEQGLASAAYGVTTGARNLATLSGIEPEPSSAFPVDDLHEELPLASWLRQSQSTPSVASASAARRAAQKSADAALATWLPTVTGSATERFTNATAFSGHSSYYLLQLSASWKLDATISPTVRAQNAAAAAAIAREAGTRRRVDDSIFQAWSQVSTDIVKAKAARAQVTAATLATGLARHRYLAGVATQLDVLQAQSEQFQAEVARIQADTDLAYARSALRLNAGQHLAQETAP